jgi:hypothetical protein
MSIAQPPTTVAHQPQPTALPEPAPQLSLKRVVAGLQVVLATRRAARNDAHAYWYTVARGM